MTISSPAIGPPSVSATIQDFSSQIHDSRFTIDGNKNTTNPTTPPEDGPDALWKCNTSG
jgi:hypothetical protein